MITTVVKVTNLKKKSELWGKMKFPWYLEHSRYSVVFFPCLLPNVRIQWQMQKTYWELFPGIYFQWQEHIIWADCCCLKMRQQEHRLETVTSLGGPAGPYVFVDWYVEWKEEHRILGFEEILEIMKLGPFIFAKTEAQEVYVNCPRWYFKSPTFNVH